MKSVRSEIKFATNIEFDVPATKTCTHNRSVCLYVSVCVCVKSCFCISFNKDKATTHRQLNRKTNLLTKERLAVLAASLCVSPLGHLCNQLPVSV